MAPSRDTEFSRAVDSSVIDALVARVSSQVAGADWTYRKSAHSGSLLKTQW